MKKVLYLLTLISLVLVGTLCSCEDNEKVIRVGATPAPHAEILNSKVVQDYVKSKG